MTTHFSPEPDPFFRTSYAQAQQLHGDLGLSQSDFQAHLQRILAKCLGTHPAPAAAQEFVRTLHTDDLYLATACAGGDPRAWRRFYFTYTPYLRQVVQSWRLPDCQARDLADSLPGHLYGPDRAGQRRIAGYDGRSPLARWLAVILHHQALKGLERKANRLERLDDCADLPDRSFPRRLEARLRAGRYQPAIAEAWRRAERQLDERERLLLRLRFVEGAAVKEIAALFAVHSSTITRQMQAVQEKLRDHFLTALAREHGLGAAAIEECLAELLENPEHAWPEFTRVS